MNNLQKVDLIKKICEEHSLTAYEISKNTGLSTLGIQNVLNGKTKKPNNKTVNTIWKFIQESIIETNLPVLKTTSDKKYSLDSQTKSKTNESKDEITISAYMLGNKNNIAKLIRFLKNNEETLLKDELFNMYLQNISTKNQIGEVKEEILRLIQQQRK